MKNKLAGFETRLAEKMAEAGMTQADLCRKTGFASSMISHYVTGQRTPSFPVVAKIAKALNTTVDYLANGNQRKPRKPSRNVHAVTECLKDYISINPEKAETDHEDMLVMMFNALNLEGKAKVITYVKDMLYIENYKTT